ncbi:MAG: type II/IV secretion system protein [Dehalococcoidales bacterium]|nr:type II/IV secretion system protein [Dehalococcoidales bacterium]
MVSSLYTKTEWRKNMPQAEALALIPEVMARKFKVIPLEVSDGTLRVAMTNPSDIFALEALSTTTHKRIEPYPASIEEVLEAIDLNYKGYDEIKKKISGLTVPVRTSDNNTAKVEEASAIDNINNTPVVQALTLIIDEAVKARASDIHLQPQEHNLRVRYRIDGTLYDMLSLPLETVSPLCSRIKILANMNIADHHRPQDGHFSINAKGRLLDIRVGTVPTVYGEMVALRLLDKSRVNLSLSQLGFLPDSLAKYEDMLKSPYGMILVSGPTGAGKTTTLYASINRLDHKALNIITIEDPVEYWFNNINQIQVNTRADVTFAAGLRSILRLDPDVILVGEIRDAETANIAVQAALTGHLVLSSIHANDTASAVLRLLDLGVEPFLASSALIGVIAQRMVRRICPKCSQPMEPSLLEKIAYQKETGEEKKEFLHGKGCQFCSNTGYHGRTGIFEIMRISDKMKMMMLNRVSISQLKEQALSEGMVNLMKDGMYKANAGITTPQEVLRNTFTTE